MVADYARGGAVKALVYHGPGNIAFEDGKRPEVRDAGDAIVRMLKTTICGTDLHILRGDVATCTPGRTPLAMKESASSKKLAAQ